MKLFQIRTNGFTGEDFQKNCLKNSIWLPWQPEFLMDFLRTCFKKEDHPRNIPVKFGSNWPSGLGVDV